MSTPFVDVLSFIATLIFFGICMVSFFTSEAKPFSDIFEIGYITDHPPQVQTIQRKNYVKKNAPSYKPVKQVKAPSQKKVSTKAKPKSVPQSIVKQAYKQTKLYADCVSALRSMGMKKSEAVENANYVFKTTQPKTIQEFIMEAFKREHH